MPRLIAWTSRYWNSNPRPGRGIALALNISAAITHCTISLMHLTKLAYCSSCSTRSPWDRKSVSSRDRRR